MSLWRSFISGLSFGLWLVTLSNVPSAKSSPSDASVIGGPRIFAAQGVVLSVNPGQLQIVIRHEAISNYMAAMTMPFAVKNPDELAGLQRGDAIIFQLHVTATESWVEHLAKTGTATLPPAERSAEPDVARRTPHSALDTVPHPLRDYHFTNELGRPVTLNDFNGQALAITFIYTRCPLPDYCPRLSKNFQEASQKLLARSGTPTNWHFLSITFDPDFDTPPMLAAYASGYQYDASHWSFLTGPADKVGELARQAGVSYEADSGTINHNFRTLIVDASGKLQMIFPTSGNLSDQIVTEMLKAATVTNGMAAAKP